VAGSIVHRPGTGQRALSGWLKAKRRRMTAGVA